MTNMRDQLFCLQERTRDDLMHLPDRAIAALLATMAGDNVQVAGCKQFAAWMARALTTEQRRRRGEKTAGDSKYTSRRRKPRF